MAQIKHYIANPRNMENGSLQVANVLASAELVPGSIVVLDELAGDPDGFKNLTVFTDKKATKALAAKGNLGIVLQGTREFWEDGRTPEGNFDWTTYTHKAGDIAPVYRLTNNAVFEISKDALQDEPSVGNYLSVDASTGKLKKSVSMVDGEYGVFKVLAEHYVPTGATFISETDTNFIKTYICQLLDFTVASK